MDLNSWILPLIVAIPFIATGIIILLDKRPDIREGVSLIAAILTFLLCILVLPSAFADVPLSSPTLQVLPGLSIHLSADALGLLFACIASGLWIITTIYNIGYMRGRGEHSQTRYYACFAITIGAVMGVALSTNLFSLFVFYEILAIAAYPLVVHTETREAMAAGQKYLIYTQGGGVAILAGMMTLLGMGCSLDFVAGGNPGISALAPVYARLAFFLLFAGFDVKAALVPLHGWLPTAMVAPTPVSGLLHAVAVVNTGVFGIFRLMWYVYGPEAMIGLGLRDIVIAAAVITIITGSLFALRQDRVEFLAPVDVFKHFEREHGDHVFLDPLDRVLRAQFPVARAGAQHLDKRKPPAVDLVLECFADRLPGPHMLFRIGQGHTLDVGGTIQGVQKLTYTHGRALNPKFPSPWRSGRLLSERSGRSHLPAGHTVNSVVHEKDRDGFSTVCRMQNLISADGGKIAIALVSKNDGVWTDSFHAGRYGRSSAMRCGDVADIHIVIHEYGASDRADQDCPIPNAELIDRFSNELVEDSMTASGAVMGYFRVPAFALIPVVKSYRSAMRNFPHTLSPFS